MQNKILIIGNIASGKTTLSLRLAKLHKLPLTHVDSLQFLPGMKIRPHQETQKMVDQITQSEKWIFDGFGPLNQIEARFAQADTIIFIDLPLWINFLWLCKRTLTNLWSVRAELPPDCNEISWGHISKAFKTLWQIHTKMRPQLLKILNREEFQPKLIHIQTYSSWKSLYKTGINEG